MGRKPHEPRHCKHCGVDLRFEGHLGYFAAAEDQEDACPKNPQAITVGAIIGLEVEGIKVHVSPKKNADGFFEAMVIEGEEPYCTMVGYGLARSKRRAKAFALREYVEAQIAKSVVEDGR